MTTEETARGILNIIEEGRASVRALYDAVLCLDARISDLEARLAEVRVNAVMVQH